LGSDVDLPDGAGVGADVGVALGAGVAVAVGIAVGADVTVAVGVAVGVGAGLACPLHAASPAASVKAASPAPGQRFIAASL